MHVLCTLADVTKRSIWSMKYYTEVFQAADEIEEYLKNNPTDTAEKYDSFLFSTKLKRQVSIIPFPFINFRWASLIDDHIERFVIATNESESVLAANRLITLIMLFVDKYSYDSFCLRTHEYER